MRRLMILCALAALAALPVSPASATGGLATGTINAPNPTNGPRIGNPVDGTVIVNGGVTFNGAPCQDDPNFRHVDGRWVNVSAHQGHAATLAPTGNVGGYPPPVDLDAWFYTTGCGFIDNDGDFAEGDGIEELPPHDWVPYYGQYGDTESGVIPANATWAYISYWGGAGQAGYRFTF